MKLWIARDKDKHIWVFKRKPIKMEIEFRPRTDVNGNDTFNRCIPTSLFPEVTFNNSPQKVEVKEIINQIEYHDTLGRKR
jgi:hypothetical protein